MGCVTVLICVALLILCARDVEKIVAEFPFFPRLHRLYCTRPNSTPPAITTGVGPDGRSTVYLQPRGSKGVEDDEDRDCDEDILGPAPCTYPIASTPTPSLLSVILQFLHLAH